MAYESFKGVLSTNLITSALYNLIIGTQTYADNISGIPGSELLNMALEDVGLYGDRKNYIAVDSLKSRPWLNYEEAPNLLAVKKPPTPKTQTLVIDTYRVIDITTDRVLSKQSFSNSTDFTQYIDAILQWINNVKRIHMTTLINRFIGCNETNTGKQTQEIQFQEVEGNIESTNKLEAMAIAEKVANIMVDVSDVGRDYNDYGFLRSYDTNDLVVVFNSEYYNKIKKTELPLFFKQDFIDKFNQHTLPSRYFGTMNTMDVTETDGLTIRSAIEQEIDDVNYFAGDLLPKGITLVDEDETKILYPTYTEDSTIICKIYHKDAIKLLSAFSINSEFYNPLSHTTSSYLVWGYSNLNSHMANYPFITLRAKAQE